MLDYIKIINCSKGFSMSGSEIAKSLGFSKSGVNDFLRAFNKCPTLEFPLPAGITNQAVHEAVYGARPGKQTDLGYCQPDMADVASRLRQPNMTLQYLWNSYR